MEQDVNQLLRHFLRVGIGFLIILSFYLLFQLSSFFTWLGFITKTIFTPLIFSLVISYFLKPIVNLLNSRGVPRGVAVGIIYVGFILILIVFLMKAIPAFLSQASDLKEHIPKFIHTYQTWLNEFNSRKHRLPEGIRIGIEQVLENIQKRTTQATTFILDKVGNILHIAIDLLVIPFVVFYLLKDLGSLRKGFLFLVQHNKRVLLSKILQEIDQVLEDYIGGQMMICLAVGILAYIGFKLIGMSYAILLSLVITITEMIPFIGPFIGGAPSILLAITISPKMALMTLLVNIIVQNLEGNVISPWIMGKRLHMHPLIIIFALLIGGELGGIIGLIFAVPIAAILRIIFHHSILHFINKDDT